MLHAPVLIILFQIYRQGSGQKIFHKETIFQIFNKLNVRVLVVDLFCMPLTVFNLYYYLRKQSVSGRGLCKVVGLWDRFVLIAGYIICTSKNISQANLAWEGRGRRTGYNCAWVWAMPLVLLLLEYSNRFLKEAFIIGVIVVGPVWKLIMVFMIYNRQWFDDSFSYLPRNKLNANHLKIQLIKLLF